MTDLTKMINGVRAVVLLEKDVNEGDLEEAELRFEAQDNAGNIWNLGEYPEEYEDGKFSAAPDVWIAGLDGAEPGYSMVGDPQLGTPEYLQGWSPDIDFLDCAKVSKMEQKTCVPVGCYENVMIIDERSPLEPESGHQLKYYAPGVGTVRVGFIDDPEGEKLVLVEASRLSPEDLAKVRQEALKLEKNAYQAQQAVWPNSTHGSVAWRHWIGRAPQPPAARFWLSSRHTLGTLRNQSLHEDGDQIVWDGLDQWKLSGALAGQVGSNLRPQFLVELRHRVEADVLLPAG